jgi:cystathionine beta-lyase/cystathionine gamma-synthase
MEVDFIDMCDLDQVEKTVKSNTRAIWIETPTNPTLKICDIKKICDIAKRYEVITCVDNTFCSPVL